MAYFPQHAMRILVMVATLVSCCFAVARADEVELVNRSEAHRLLGIYHFVDSPEKIEEACKSKKGKIPDSDIALAKEWALHGYDAKKFPMPSTYLVDPSIANMHAFVRNGFRTLEATPQMSKDQIKKKYRNLVNELEAYKDDPLFEKGVMQQRKRYDEAWEAIEHHFKHPFERRLPMLTVWPGSHWIDDRAPHTEVGLLRYTPLSGNRFPVNHSIVNDAEYALELSKAFQREGIDGVIDFLDPDFRRTGKQTYRIGHSDKMDALEQVFSKNYDLWLKNSTREQRVALITVAYEALTSRYEWRRGHDAFDEKVYRERVKKLYRKLVPNEIRQAKTADEYFRLMKEWKLLTDKNEPNLIRELLFVDGTSHLRATVEYGLSAPEVYLKLRKARDIDPEIDLNELIELLGKAEAGGMYGEMTPERIKKNRRSSQKP